MKKLVTKVVMFAIMLLVLAGCDNKQNQAENSQNKYKLDSIEYADDGTGFATYDKVKHEFILDLPNNSEGAPLIVMLHGYGGTAEAFRSQTCMEVDANALGYAVVYVTGAPNPEDTTSASGWNSGIGVSSVKDVEFLCALVSELCETYHLDDTRVFAVGFSNGAFMTHRLAIEASDTFAAVVSVAGMMPESVWESKPSECNIGVFQITGSKDDVVPKNSDGSAKYSQAPAIEDAMDYYVAGNKLTLSEKKDVGKKSVLTKYDTINSNKKVWNLYIPDGRHSWPEEKITGFDTNILILEFLETQ